MRASRAASIFTSKAIYMAQFHLLITLEASAVITWYLNKMTIYPAEKILSLAVHSKSNAAGVHLLDFTSFLQDHIDICGPTAS